MLNIAGMSKLSTVDWLGNIVVSLFLQGCPWRCNYCHNSEILNPHVQGSISFENDVLPHLEKRVGLLDGVVFSGGEPLMQANGDDGGDLLAAIKVVKQFKDKSLGNIQAYKIGLHTGGAYPDALRKIIPHLDWIGFDVKAPTGLYNLITNVKNSELNARKSLNYILEEQEFRKNSDSPLAVTFRTTVDPTVLSSKDVEKLQFELEEKGITNLVLQEVRTQGAPVEYAKTLVALQSNK